MNETQQSPEETQLDYAGFWVRVWASIIDTVLFGLLLMPVLARWHARLDHEFSKHGYERWRKCAA